MPSECVGEAGFTDTLRPHADYGSRLVERLSEGIQPLFLGIRFYTDAQLADKFNISMRTLREYRDSGLIAYYRLDGKILYADDDVETF